MHLPVITTVVLLLFARVVDAQSDLSRVARDPILIVSVGGGMLLLNDVDDGPSSSLWNIESTQERRVGLELGLGQNATIGVALSRASLELLYTRYRLDDVTLQACATGCDATADYTTIAATVRMTSGPGLHFVAELGAGFSEYSDLRERRTGTALAPLEGDRDFGFTLGSGVGWAPGRRFQISLIGDLGFTIHKRSGRDGNLTHMNWLTGVRLVMRSGILPL